MFPVLNSSQVLKIASASYFTSVREGLKDFSSLVNIREGKSSILSQAKYYLWAVRWVGLLDNVVNDQGHPIRTSHLLPSACDIASICLTPRSSPNSEDISMELIAIERHSSKHDCLPNYTGYPKRNGQNFGRVFLTLNYTDITQNTYIQSWTVTEIMAREVWNFDSCYTLIDYQIRIKNGRNMWFL